jgi:hypothetical protein
LRLWSSRKSDEEAELQLLVDGDEEPEDKDESKLP